MMSDTIPLNQPLYLGYDAANKGDEDKCIIAVEYKKYVKLKQQLATADCHNKIMREALEYVSINGQEGGDFLMGIAQQALDKIQTDEQSE